MVGERGQFYVTCTSCSFRSYRQGHAVGMGSHSAAVKPCPRCGSRVVVRNQRRKGQRGPNPGPIPHGTRQGYARGCRKRCCVSVERAYQRESYARRKAANRGG